MKKLTKAEQEFLLSWLSDDLDIVKKDQDWAKYYKKYYN